MTASPPPGLLAVPMIDWMYSRSALSLMSLSHNLPKGSNMSFHGGHSTICGKRNAAARDLLESDAAWLLFVDSDLVVPRNLAFRLLQTDADIVGGLYTLKNPDFTAVAGHEAGPRSEDPLRPTDAADWKVRPLDLRKVGPEMGVVDVDVVGTGAMLIRRHVLEALEAPWFVANGRTARDSGGYGQNEDYNFCLRARDAGFRVVCDTTIQCEHIGPVGITVPMAQGHWRAKLGLGA